jgi:hypothetical protein
VKNAPIHYARTPNAQLQAARALLISRINEFVRDAVLAKYDELHGNVIL